MANGGTILADLCRCYSVLFSAHATSLDLKQIQQAFYPSGIGPTVVISKHFQGEFWNFKETYQEKHSANTLISEHSDRCWHLNYGDRFTVDLHWNALFAPEQIHDAKTNNNEYFTVSYKFLDMRDSCKTRVLFKSTAADYDRYIAPQLFQTRVHLTELGSR